MWRNYKCQQKFVLFKNNKFWPTENMYMYFYRNLKAWQNLLNMKYSVTACMSCTNDHTVYNMKIDDGKYSHLVHYFG